MARQTRHAALQRQRDRLLEDRLHAREELGRRRAAEDAVVAGDRDVHPVTRDDLAVADDRLLLHLPDGEDRCLRWVDDRRERRHPVHAEVRDRERRARQLGRADLAVADLLGQRARLRRDLAEALAVGVEDRRDDERALAGDRDADVDPAVQLEAAVLVGAVDEREVAQGDRARLDDHVVVRRHGRALLLGEGLELLAQLDRALHVDVHRQREVRDRRLRLRHPPGDDLLDPRGLLDGALALALLAGRRGLGLGLLLGLIRLRLLRLAGLRRLGLGLGLGGLRLARLGLLGAVAALGGGGLDVGLDDAPARAGALERREVDAVLAGDPPRDRRRLRPAAVALGRRRALGLRLRAAAVPVAAVAVRAVALCGRLLLALLLLGLLGLRAGLLGLRGPVVVLVAALVLRLGGVLLGGLRRGPAAVGRVRVALRARLLLRLAARLGRAAAALADARDDLADRERRALVGDDLERSVGVGLVRHRGLVGLDLDELVALRDVVALRLEPLEDRPLLHRVGEAGHRDVGHSARCY